MLTKQEYEKIAIRMFDSIRDVTGRFGECSCDGVIDCAQCPLNPPNCTCDCFAFPNSLERFFNTLTILEKWNKEHPIVTYESKYEETFGVKPLTEDGDYACPSNLGFTEHVNCSEA